MSKLHILQNILRIAQIYKNNNKILRHYFKQGYGNDDPSSGHIYCTRCNDDCVVALEQCISYKLKLFPEFPMKKQHTCNYFSKSFVLQTVLITLQ